MGVLEYLLVPALRLLCGAPPRWCSNYFPKKLRCLEGAGGDKERVNRDNKQRERRVYAVPHDEKLVAR